MLKHDNAKVHLVCNDLHVPIESAGKADANAREDEWEADIALPFTPLHTTSLRTEVTFIKLIV